MRSNEIANLAGVTVRTLRHYHAIGLLPEPPRTDNGYRTYSHEDLARLLRIKRLSSLGFSLDRIGSMLDASGAETTNDALDELDHELTARIEQLEEQRRTIATLKREQLDPELPVRFSRAMKPFTRSKCDTAESSDGERMLVLLAAHLYEDDDLEDLEHITGEMIKRGMVDRSLDLDERLDMLPAHASEEERCALADETLELLEPLLHEFDAAKWNRPYTPIELLLLDYQNKVYNEAQNDVFARINRILEQRILAQVEAQDTNEHNPSTASH